MRYNRLDREFANMVCPGLKGGPVRETARICKDIKHMAKMSIRHFFLAFIAVIGMVFTVMMKMEGIVANAIVTIGTVFLLVWGMFAMYCYGRYSLIRPMYDWIRWEIALRGSRYEEKEHDGESEK